MNESSKYFSYLWRKKMLDFDKLNSQDKADSLRFFLSQISFLKQTNNGFEEPWDLESMELELRKKYAHLMDSKTGVNNYAEAVLSLRNGFKNESMKWKSNLKPEDLQGYISLKEDAKDLENEYFRLGRCYQLTDPRVLKEPIIMKGSDSSISKETVCPNFDIDSSHLFGSKNEFSPFHKAKTETLPYYQPHARSFLHAQPSSNVQREPSLSSSQKMTSDLRSRERSKRYPWETHKGNDESTSNKPASAFKTASHQLAIENMKRGASAKDMYGSAKRSLGPRGVKTGFVPPIRRDSDKESDWVQRGEGNSSRHEGSGPHAELLGDERLKNVEAKMVELIMNEILDNGPPVTWDDIAGLQVAKSTIQEIVVWPMLRPDIFTGLRGPPKGILLFGPPGTGKTMIGKCIASQSRSTFFSISASSLTSKWVGEGEKMVRAMFAVARCHQPAVIFIDEIDSLLTQRSDTEHESSRRIKTEFLVQLDGATSGQDERLLVVGATNRPQELDEAARRRLVKRLYIPLPDPPAREQIMKNLLADQKHTLTPADLKDLSERTDGYSGADVANLCREAALGPIRSIDFADIQRIAVDEVRPISKQDFDAALNSIRASVSTQDLHLYQEWNTKYGIKN